MGAPGLCVLPGTFLPLTLVSKTEMHIILALLSGDVLTSQGDDRNSRALKNKENFFNVKVFGQWGQQ